MLRKTVQKSYYFKAYIHVRPRLIAFYCPKPCKSYCSCPYIDVQTRVMAFCSAKPCKLGSLGTGARPRALGLGQSHGVQAPGEGRGVLDCAWTRKPDCEEARLLAGLPDVLLPVRSVKC